VHVSMWGSGLAALTEGARGGCAPARYNAYYADSSWYDDFEDDADMCSIW
jgi:hypothetical protein